MYASAPWTIFSPSEPSGPPNCRFEIADLEEEWTWSHPFDYIFTRMMAGSFGDWDKYMRRAYKCVLPPSYSGCSR